MLALRPYQQDATDAVDRAEARGLRRVLVNLPTGGGKTIIFSALTKKRQVPTLILVNRRELVEQAVDKLKMVWPEAPVGVWKGSHVPSTPIVVATVQTLASKTHLLTPDRFQLAICDEAHHAVSPSWRRVLEATGFLPDPPPGKLLVGVSATLTREDGLGLDNVFQDIVYSISLLDLIRAGYLADLRALRIKSHVRLDGVQLDRNGDFNEAQLGLAVDMPDRNDLIARAYLQFAQGRRAITFTADVTHSRHLTEAMRARGIRAEWVAGELPDKVRDARIRDFREGRLDVIVNAQLLTEGFDAPEISCVIMARPTKSLALYTQQVGRGTRLAPGKRDCLILDVADVSQYHDLLSVASLVGKSIDESRDMVPRKESPAIAREPKEGPDILPVTGSLQGDRVDLFTGSVFRWLADGRRWVISVNRWTNVILRPALSDKHDDYYEAVLVDRRQAQPVALTLQPMPLDWAMGVAEDWLRNHGGSTVRRDDPSRDGPPTAKQQALAAELGITWPESTTREVASHLLEQARKARAIADPTARWRQQPATERQRAYAALKGIEIPPDATKAEASQLLTAAPGQGRAK